MGKRLEEKRNQIKQMGDDGATKEQLQPAIKDLVQEGVKDKYLTAQEDQGQKAGLLQHDSEEATVSDDPVETEDTEATVSDDPVKTEDTEVSLVAKVIQTSANIKLAVQHCQLQQVDEKHKLLNDFQAQQEN